MSAMRVLVTGGAGFIASHIVDAYIAEGWDVTVLDDLSTGDAANVNLRARFVEGSIADGTLLDALFREGFDLVNHHAAQIDVRKSVADPAWDAEINVVGSLRLFERAVAAGTKRVIFASSGGAIYGEPQFAPQSEDHPVAPLSPYGCAKLAIEQYLHFYSVVHGLRWVAMRYANVYGPRQRTDGEAGVVAIFGGRLLQGQPVTINGDGGQTRDFVFVGDLARANVAVAKGDFAGPFNVGTGVETTVNELFVKIAEALGVESVPEHGPAKEGEQRRSVLDGSKLRREAGLQEPVELSDGLASTMAWLGKTLAV